MVWQLELFGWDWSLGSHIWLTVVGSGSVSYVGGASAILNFYSNVVDKATRMLNFLKRHFSKCSSNVKASAYLLMVRALMEYACVVWDPHYQSQVSVLEKVQRRAARWVLSDYSYHSSVSSMLEQLNWLPLAKRRKQQRLSLFYQIMYGEIGSSLPDCYRFTNKYTRQHHPFFDLHPPTPPVIWQAIATFPRTIQEWTESTATTTDWSEESSHVSDQITEHL